jgi:glucokinase
MNYVAGIDIGGTTVKIGLFDLEGTLHKKWEVFTNLADHGKYILSDIAKSFSEKGIDLSDIFGYGFGVPGPVVKGRVIRAVNIGWEYFDLALEFSQLVNNSNVHVGNDANVAALGESYRGAARGKKDVVMITLGTGVGGGIITNGTSVDGAFGLGGEIGHIVVSFDHPRQCNCGSKGCLETVASATGIKSEFEYLKQNTNLESSLKDVNFPSAKMIIDAAKNGDELCSKVVESVSFYLAYVCHIMSVTVNPEVIVFGGGVSKAGDYLIDKIREKFLNYKFVTVKDTVIRLAELGNDAGMYGAAYLVIND